MQALLIQDVVKNSNFPVLSVKCKESLLISGLIVDVYSLF